MTVAIFIVLVLIWLTLMVLIGNIRAIGVQICKNQVAHGKISDATKNILSRAESRTVR